MGFLILGASTPKDLLDVSFVFLHYGRVADTNLERLGRLVISRRVQLGYKHRIGLAQVVDFGDRVLADIENGTRRAGAGTYAMLENALEWQPGSVAAILGGKEPTPVPHVRAEFTSTGSFSATAVDLRSVPAETLLEEIRRRLAAIHTGPTAPVRASRGTKAGASGPDDDFDFQEDAP